MFPDKIRVWMMVLGIVSALFVSMVISGCGDEDEIVDETLTISLLFDTAMDTAFPPNFQVANNWDWLSPSAAYAIADNSKCVMFLNVTYGTFRRGLWLSTTRCDLEFDDVPSGLIQAQLNGAQCTNGFRNAQGTVTNTKNFEVTNQAGETYVTVNIPF